MKKKIALFTVLIALCSIVLSSYHAGTASSGFNCTGAQASSTSCSGSVGCHGDGNRNTVHIRVDSTGSVPVGGYVPGMTYTVTVSGTSPLPMPVFGFQFTAVKGTGASQSLAGTYAGFPTNVTSNPYSGLLFVEQTAAINAVTPGIYQESFKWVAPSAGAGIITMYLTLLSANANTYADTGDVSGNVDITLMERYTSAVAGIEQLPSVLFPNPCSNILNIQMPSNVQGDCVISVYGLDGRSMLEQHTAINNFNNILSLQASALDAGIYKVVVVKDGMRSISTFVKQ
jgi:hypothetical protein